MQWKLVFLACSLLVVLLSCVVAGKSIPSNQYQSGGESEVEFVTPDNTDGFAPGGFPSGFPGGSGGIPGYPQEPTSIFKDWMNFIQGFFKGGNWDNGGPRNFAKFLGDQISRLISLLTRDDSGFGKK